MWSREAVVAEVGMAVLDLTQRVNRCVGGMMSDWHVGVMVAVRARAEELEDPHESPRAARAIMGMMFAEEDPPPRFWASATGRACAYAIGFHRQRVPVSQVAAILNISRQRVSQLADEGKLARVEGETNIVASSLREHLWRYGRRPDRV